MHTGKGQVLELILEDGYRQARLACPSNLIPAPGQYLLAGDGSYSILSLSKCSPLPVPLFYTDSSSQGLTVAPIPDSWQPGLELYLRGPLGRAFKLPLFARNVGLIALDMSPALLKGLIGRVLKQDAAVVLVSASTPESLPDDVEVQPMSALDDVVAWADYVAFDVARENLHLLRQRVGKIQHWMSGKEGQVLVHTPVPCGGLADCGICAVTTRSGWKLACKDGPVFDWHELV